jgi:ABC-type transport system involved in multi-copper enzyme maturation permease subunit
MFLVAAIRTRYSEAAGPINLLVAAAVLWTLGYWLPLGLTLSLWLAWAVAVAILQRRGHLQVFGPVLFYDMVRTARRNRYVLLRCLYAGFLMLLLFFVYSIVSETRLDNRQHAARLAEDFFQWFMLVQLIFVVLLTPAYVGGAVAEEKERRTLEFILATDLRNQEVVLSKLGSRLANLTLFLLTGLPILSLLQFLGGIDPNLVLTGFAVTGLTMLGIGSLSLLYSVLLRRPRDAIALTYLCCIAYIATGGLALSLQKTNWWLLQLPVWFGSDPPTLYALTTLVNAGNPLALIIETMLSGRAGGLATRLPELLRDYATFHLLLTVGCLGLSIGRLRVVGLRQTVGREIKAKDARRARAPIGALPMIWKETLEGQQRLGWSAWVVFIILGAITLGIGLWIYGNFIVRHLWDFFALNWNVLRLAFDPWQGLQREMNVWARLAGGCVATVTLLWAAVRASTSISVERDKQTFDALITTQLNSDSVLGAKLLGSLLGVRMGLAWYSAILVLACVTGGVHPLALALAIGGWIMYACFFSLIGLWFSMVCATSTRATVTTVLVSLGLGGGHWLIWMCLGPLAYWSHAGPDSFFEMLMKFEVGMTPPIVLGVFSFCYEDLRHDGNREFAEMMAYCLLGIILWSAACAALWFGLLAPRFRHLMRREHSFLP